MYPKRLSPFGKRACTIGKSYSRTKVKAILIKKYQSKFGTRNNPQMNSFICDEVDKLLRRNNATQSQLYTIEKKLSNFGRDVNSSLSITHTNPQALAKPEVNKSMSLLPPIKQSISFLEEDYWGKIAEYEVEKYKDCLLYTSDAADE
eukprot:TRINITY_DN15633_c0_g1_i13.p2 TRINITY_DN15633_c0_g1~~TRINITY_DN15633_c0_g1_i13.p2  ORF type:complete len:147 (+),score=32.46 TRINITY_DN15633_c0_g1_i13:217-657(+)